jgi:hypothetical protein
MTTMGSVQEMCDVCGQAVPADDMVKAELTAAGAMCPSAMTFHTACYEKASSMWQPDPESYCTVDPLFPETGQWTLPDSGSVPSGGGGASVTGEATG